MKKFRNSTWWDLKVEEFKFDHPHKLCNKDKDKTKITFNNNKISYCSNKNNRIRGLIKSLKKITITIIIHQ